MTNSCYFQLTSHLKSKELQILKQRLIKLWLLVQCFARGYNVPLPQAITRKIRFVKTWWLTFPRHVDIKYNLPVPAFEWDLFSCIHLRNLVTQQIVKIKSYWSDEFSFKRKAYKLEQLKRIENITFSEKQKELFWFLKKCNCARFFLLSFYRKIVKFSP